MRLLRPKLIQSVGAVLFCGLALLAPGHVVLSADERTSATELSTDGRRLILLYGDKQVDLRSPKPTAASPTTPDVPWVTSYQELGQPSAAPVGGTRGSPPSRQSGEASPESREHLEFICPAEQRARRFLNLLRPAAESSASSATRSAPPTTDDSQATQLPAETPPPGKPSAAVTGSTSAVGTPASGESMRRQFNPGNRRVEESASSAFSRLSLADRLEHRLALLVIALLCAVLCLIVIVVQLLTAMGRFTGTLVPTIRLEMSNTGQGAGRAAGRAAGRSRRPRPMS